MLAEGAARDIVYTPLFTGVAGNYLKPSIAAAGLDPDALPEADKTKMDFASADAKAWRDIWGAGQGLGAIADAPPTAELVARMTEEYAAVKAALLSVG
jgi:nitronate monooxygenase